MSDGDDDGGDDWAPTPVAGASAASPPPLGEGALGSSLRMTAMTTPRCSCCRISGRNPLNPCDGVPAIAGPPMMIPRCPDSSIQTPTSGLWDATTILKTVYPCTFQSFDPRPLDLQSCRCLLTTNSWVAKPNVNDNPIHIRYHPHASLKWASLPLQAAHAHVRGALRAGAASGGGP